ncbi:MAG: 4-(cytidine 5'-diphospho)-2-C-methyl-D-erythritol kinase [Solobacterium sp.]|nr:4-(cytidine 5'-diphospho)-2-C-methyl-D-erythritol kinase [Solobacterium sp.]
MKDRAFAKINLCLDVIGGKEDGYHELKMIMVPLDFYDVLEMHVAREMHMELNRSYLPVNEKNTIVKAIEVMRSHFGFKENFSCILTKHIPTQAGLAGGSADGAAAIRLINKLLGYNYPLEKLLDIAREVGSDVPFCLLNEPAYVEGTGEKLQTFNCASDFHILLVKPKRGVSTRDAFAHIDAIEEYIHPDCKAMQRALEEDDYEGVVSSLGNSLEVAAFEMVPEIKEIKDSLIVDGFDGVLMSGSGSTVFAISKNEDLLYNTMEKYKEKRYFVRKTKIFKKEKRR